MDVTYQHQFEYDPDTKKIIIIKAPEESGIKGWVKKLFNRIPKVKMKLVKLSGGSQRFDPESGTVITTELDSAAIESIVPKYRSGEVITPTPLHTPEDLASMMSCAACDHEFRQVILYPIDPERRAKVMELLLTDPVKYPMYEYREAGLIGKDDLNSQMVLYKYYAQSHYTKPV
jgi:hypothetical protein